MDTRRKYDREFKIETVRLVTEEGRKATEVARNLGIHVNLIYLWKKQLGEDPKEAFPGLGRLKGKVFRIGHLGDFNELMLAGTLSGIEMSLSLFNVPFSKGGVTTALDYLSRQ